MEFCAIRRTNGPTSPAIVPCGPPVITADTRHEAEVAVEGAMQRLLALVFTGGESGEGTEHVLSVLQAQDLRAGLFVTGDYLASDPMCWRNCRTPPREAGVYRCLSCPSSW